MLNNRDKKALKLRGYSYYFKSKLLPFKPVIVDRYLFLEFLKSCFGAIIFFAFIFEMTQLFYQINTYMSREGIYNTTERIIMIHVSKLPYDIILFSPLGFLFGTMFTLSNFYKNNEVVTVVGSGVHLFRFTLPILLFSLIYSIFLIFFGEFVMSPLFDKSEVMLWELRRQKPYEDHSQGVKDLKISGENGINYNNIGYFNPKTNVMKDGIIVTRASNYTMKQTSQPNEEKNEDKEEALNKNKDISNIVENIIENNKIIQTVKENENLLSKDNPDRINTDKNLNNIETGELTINDIYPNEIDTQPGKIFEPDIIPKEKDIKPNIPKEYFLTRTETTQTKEKTRNENTPTTNQTQKENTAKTTKESIQKENSTQNDAKINDKKEFEVTTNKITPERKKNTNVTPEKKRNTNNNDNKNAKANDEPTMIYSNNYAPKQVMADDPQTITEQRKNYDYRTELLNSYDTFSYDDTSSLKLKEYEKPDVKTTPTETDKKKHKTKTVVDSINREAVDDFVNVILKDTTTLYKKTDEDYREFDKNQDDNKHTGKVLGRFESDEQNKFRKKITKEEEKINKEISEKIDYKKDKETITKKINEDKDQKINEEKVNKTKEKNIEDIKTTREKETATKKSDIENINTDDFTNMNMDKPDIGKIKEITKQTYVNEKGKKEELVDSDSLKEPIALETNNENIELDIDGNSKQDYKETPATGDTETVPYYLDTSDINFRFDEGKYESNEYDDRTINLRLDAECLTYLKDGWYAKCRDNKGNFVDTKATLWEWDTYGNLLFGYPKDKTGQKIDIIKDKPFHFEDNTRTKMETISFKKGLQIVEKLRKSGKVYKAKESELFGRKIYFPFASFIITLLGIGLGKFHTKKGMLISTFFFALLFFAFYYVVYQLGESLGGISAIPIPGWLAPALGNIVFLLISFYVISRSKT